MVRKKQKHTGCKALLLSLVVLLALFIGITVASTPHEVSSGSVSWPQGVELPAPVPGEQQVSHCGYALSYNEQYEQPSWVAYQLTCDEVVGTIERTDNFRPDPAILTRSASLDDYRSSGYDRGHLIPAADQKWSAQAMDDSFYLSNMSPQTGAFNRGIWSHLEAVVRTFANDNGAIYIATGPVLFDGPYKTIGKNQVAVPNQFYKVILFYDGKKAKAIGFILNNEGSIRKVEDFATSVDDVEKLTHLDFFVALPDPLEIQVEASYNLDEWNFKEFKGGEKPTGNGGNGQKDTRRTILLLTDKIRKQALILLKSLS